MVVGEEGGILPQLLILFKVCFSLRLAAMAAEAVGLE